MSKKEAAEKISEILAYCKGHCDSDEEYALVEWVEEKFREAGLTPAVRQVQRSA